MQMDLNISPLPANPWTPFLRWTSWDPILFGTTLRYSELTATKVWTTPTTNDRSATPGPTQLSALLEPFPEIEMVKDRARRRCNDSRLQLLASNLPSPGWTAVETWTATNRSGGVAVEGHVEHSTGSTGVAQRVCARHGVPNGMCN